MKTRRVYVVKQTSPTTFRTVRRFTTVKQAEEWIGALKNQESVNQGHYSIDAPEGWGRRS